MSQQNAVRNAEGIWINTQLLREEALTFQRYGYYCPDPEGSPDWYNYWQEQRRRCKFGYTVGGVRITGDHYFYLNFCPILKVEEDITGDPATRRKSRQVKKGSKKVDFPDFFSPRNICIKFSNLTLT